MCAELGIPQFRIIAEVLTVVSWVLEFGYCGTIGYPTYTVVAGGRAEIPCDLNFTSAEDDVSLILWHRDNTGSPVYTMDAREGALHAAKHFPAAEVSSRAYFNATGTPSTLRIDDIQKGEEGVYRCRVEFKRSRTETADMMLNVIAEVSSRAYFNATGTPSTLRIDDIQKGEEGVYRCRVEIKISRTETGDMMLNVISEVILRAYFNATGTPSTLRIDDIQKGEEGVYRCRVEFKRSRTETADMMLNVIAEVSWRAYFNATGRPSTLMIDDIQKSEEGVYRCRVELKSSRTSTSDMMLTVIVPPKEAIIMDEYGQHLHGVIGPYNEGFPLSLACEGEGGDPSPAVRWWKDTELLDDSYYITPQGFARNELLLASLKRTDLMTRLTCQVSNNNFTAPVTSSVIIDMNLKPTDVQIRSLYRPLSVERSADIVCVALGARPPAQVSWWLDGEKLTSQITESTARDENLTVSTLIFNPSKHDNQRNLSCRGDNPQVPDSVLEDSWVLDIHFPPQLSVKIDKQLPIQEGTDISLTCIVEANPPIAELEWLKDGESLGPPLRKDTRNRTLNIQTVGPEHVGRYQCAAINSEGRSVSDPETMKVQYSPRCRSVRSSVYGVGRSESVSVVCEVESNPPPQSFSWSLDGSAVLPSDRYVTNGSKSILTISPKTPQDYGDLMCWASNTIGRQKEPCTFRIVPAGPPEEPRNCIVANRTARCVVLECEGGEDGGLKQVFQLEVFGTDSDRFLANITSHTAPTFTVCSLPPRSSLMLLVYSMNSKGRSKPVTIDTSTMSLNGSDDDDDSGTLAAILGVVIGAIVVLVLLGIVVTLAIKFQKRKKNAKGRTYRPDIEKPEAYHLKECKEPCVASNQGPDIIPEKSFFQERSDSLPKVIEVEQGVNPASAQSDPSSRKYREYQSVTYPDDPALLATPRKLRMLHDAEVECADRGIAAETPLISSIPPILQQWPNHKKETVRLSTPV